MKRYDIVSFYNMNNEKQYIVFSTSYISPLKYVKEIEKELSCQVCEKIEVFFDLLLSSGNGQERYGKAIFDVNEFNRNSFEYIRISKNDNLRKISANYYKDCKSYIDNSILNSIQKKMICKGICI